MKVAIVGAAGVRTPQLVSALLLYAEELGLDEIRLVDIDEQRLEWMGLVVRELNRRAARPVALRFSGDPSVALEAVDFAFFTIRVGGMEARLADEQIPLRYGVLGQETTGPGGLSMALRTVPVMVKYLETLEERSPGAWAINLTNPAGLITQALTDRGFSRVVGICDSPAELFREIAAAIGLEEGDLWFDYFGLNHLGWIKRIVHRGKDLLPGILEDGRALLRHGREVIPASLIRALGVIPNEYLVFYYCSRQVVERLQVRRLTRAMVIDELNRRLFAGLAALAGDPEGQAKALEVYRIYARARDASYLQLETAAGTEGALSERSDSERTRDGITEPGVTQPAVTEPAVEASHPEGSKGRAGAKPAPWEPGAPSAAKEGVTAGADAADLVDLLWDQAASSLAHPAHSPEGASGTTQPSGYSGIALRVLRGLHGTAPSVTAVNTVNGWALGCLDPTDVVEIPSLVDRTGIHPFRVDAPIPEHCRALLQAVKGYERLAAKAALEQSYDIALQALIVHPLVPDARVAQRILDDLVAAHRQFLGGGLVSKLGLAG